MVRNDKEPARQRRSNGNLTYDGLIEAALGLWAEGGIDRVTMNSVAERAGRTRGTVYHHFADRDALLAAVRAHLDKSLAVLFSDTNFVQGNPYEVVSSLAAENPELVRFYVHSILSRDPNTDPLLKNARAFFGKLMERGELADDVDPDHVALVTIGMWSAATLAVLLGRTIEERREQGHRFARTFEQVVTRAFLKAGQD